MRGIRLGLAWIAVSLIGCGGGDAERAPGTFVVSMLGVTENGTVPLKDGSVLPEAHCGGDFAYDDVSPAFHLRAFPKGTKAWAFFVLVNKGGGEFRPYFMTADHAPGFENDEFQAGRFNLVSRIENVLNPTPGADGNSIWTPARRERIYHGPQPGDIDVGTTYHVHFRFVALDRTLGLRDGFTLDEFEKSARGRILDEVLIRTTFTVE